MEERKGGREGGKKKERESCKVHQLLSTIYQVEIPLCFLRISMVKNPHYQCRGTGSIPGQKTKTPHAAHCGQKYR